MLQKLIFLFFNIVFSRLPGGRCSYFKCMFLRLAGVEIGRHVYIDYGACICCVGGKVVIGDDVYIGRNVMLECNSGSLEIAQGVEINYGSLLSANGGASLVIGEGTHIAHFVSLKCSTQKIELHGRDIAGDSVYENIIIGSGCWLCAGCIVLPGVMIGARNVIAAGAVVTKSSPANVLLAGVPAQIKKFYSQKGEI